MRCLYDFEKYEKGEQKKITVKKNNYDINNEKAQEIYSFLVLYFNIIYLYYFYEILYIPF